EADDRDGLAVEEGEVCVVVVVHGSRDPIFLTPTGVPCRARARRRGRTNMQVRYVGCLLAALLLGACGGSGGAKHTVAPGPQRLDVTARDFALRISGSSTLRPGPVSITARNIGRQAHGMVLVKLNDGVDERALVTALTTKPADVPSLLTYVGGTTTLPRGSS